MLFALLLKIDIGDEDDDDSEGSDTEGNETLDLSRITEMRVVPSDPNQGDTDLCSLYVLCVLLICIIIIIYCCHDF